MRSESGGQTADCKSVQIGSTPIERSNMRLYSSLVEENGLETEFLKFEKMMDTKIKGRITEQRCYLKCLEYGYQVSRPLFDDARYDFILDTGSKLLKIQIKSSVWNEDKTAFSFNGYSQHSTGNGNKRMKYTSKEIDYFMTEKDGLFYLYPADEKGFVSKVLRIASKQNQKNISWAKDYLFEEVSKTF